MCFAFGFLKVCCSDSEPRKCRKSKVEESAGKRRQQGAPPRAETDTDSQGGLSLLGGHRSAIFVEILHTKTNGHSRSMPALAGCVLRRYPRLLFVFCLRLYFNLRSRRRVTAYQAISLLFFFGRRGVISRSITTSLSKSGSNMGACRKGRGEGGERRASAASRS